jgi:hypothetical protein
MPMLATVYSTHTSLPITLNERARHVSFQRHDLYIAITGSCKAPRPTTSRSLFGIAPHLTYCALTGSWAATNFGTKIKSYSGPFAKHFPLYINHLAYPGNSPYSTLHERSQQAKRTERRAHSGDNLIFCPLFCGID